MLFRSRDLEAILAGRVTVAFRRWKKPTVKAGSQVRSQMGLIAIESVEEIDPATLTEDDAVAANHPSLAELHRMFAAGQGACYRILLHPGGPDPREALRNSELDGPARAELAARLARLDGESPWTEATLRAIATHPGVVSTRLAAMLGRERFDLKNDIRKLKRLGLTVSLETGYRLSPRGEAWLKS